jgi:dienelactone hydrolase
VLLLAGALFAVGSRAAEVLPGTAPLTWPEADLSGRLMDGAHQLVERKIDEAPARRAAFWARDFSSAEAYTRSVAARRERLRTIIGAVDARLAPGLEQYGDTARPALVAETARYRVWQVRWPVLDGVWGAGLWVQPKGRLTAGVVVVPDAGQSPEKVLGLADSADQVLTSSVRQWAESGVELIIPVTVSREKLVTDDATLRRSDQTYREWIYRQAFHLGRHVIGYEVQTVLAAVDGLRARHGADVPVGVAGHAEGGLVAFYAAAIDPRIRAALVSGYFDSRQQVSSEPIYRNVWGLLREFGDAEIAGLILPRELVIEHAPGPSVTGHKGEWRPPELARVEAEVRRIETGPHWARPSAIHGAGGARVGPFSPAAVGAFARGLGIAIQASGADARGPLTAGSFDPAPRHRRYVSELEGHVQKLIAGADQVRDKFFLHAVMPELADNKWSTERRHPLHSADKFVAGAAPYRERFHDEGLGRFDEALVPFNARTRRVAESDRWTAYDVVLDVWPEMIAWGVLVVPKDLKPGERRPVVVCQHGRNGVPRDTVDGNKTAYNNFAAVLAERGFVTFAPHNLYRGEDRYRWLSRKANTVQASLFSFILAQHDQILRWLGTQSFVDPARIAFYGLSYGGETAVRVPTILEGYALSICSGDFNQWTRKVAATDQPFTFMRTIEWEMPYWNLGHTFDYAEMAYLMIPRPFMVERGHYDRVGRDAWVAHEYGKVRWLYATLGLGDRTEIEFFPGGHSINGEGTFDFLHRNLKWPAPSR